MRSFLYWLVAALLATTASAPAEAAWIEAKTNHFVIYSQQKPEELREYAARLERFDSGVRAVRQMKDPPATATSRLTVYVVRDARSVAQLLGATGSGIAGVYFGRASGPVSIVNSEPKRNKWDLDGRTVFFHEYLHHLMLQDATAAYPTWMTEGYAEFFATAEFRDDGSVEFGAPPHYRGAELRWLRGLPLPQMLGGIYHQLTGEEWVSQYSRGWLLTHYLAFEPSRRGQVTRYADLIQTGMPALDAAKQAFGDLKQLEKELERYHARDTLETRIIPASLIKVGPVEIRPLDEDEQVAVNLRIRLEGSEDVGTARVIAGAARSNAERFPRSTAVMEVLARAEFQAKHYSEAAAAADKALALNPKAFKALIYKGRAQLELAKMNPTTADWPSIRRWFSKANRLDPISPEPLMYYYQAFAEQGATPPALAVDGLLFAVELVPQDDDLRLMAVRQLLREGNTKDAGAVFAPIAYRPHSGKTKRRNLEIMDKIVGGDSNGALVMLDEDEKKRRKKS
jgi:tetratricopeptide (TPR) repeat protein